MGKNEQRASGHRSIIVLLLFAALMIVALPAMAAKGGGRHGGGSATGNGTVVLVLMDGATQAQHGGRVTFDVSTTATDRPFVGVRCYQGSNFVLDGYVGYFPEYMFDPWVTLDSPYWADGLTATCTARLFYYDKRGGQNVLATTAFDAVP